MKEEYPIRHVLVRDFFFEEASTLDELADRLGRAGFFLLRARENVLAATTKVKPYIVLFLFIQRTQRGGEFILIETHKGWFSYDDLLEHLPAIESSAGIKILTTNEPNSIPVA